MTTQKTTLPDPPRGLRAIPWRLPIWLYRLKLGRLMGHRALLLQHVGHLSGKPRQAMLEVIHFEREENIHYVASGFGEKAHWYQNIQHTPDVTIEVAGENLPVRAERLPEDTAERIFRDYHHRHPNALKNLSKLVGYTLSGNDEEMIAFFREHIPVIAFRPR